MTEQQKRTRRAEPITKHVAKNGKISYRLQVDVGQDDDGRRLRVRSTHPTLKDARAEHRRVTAEVAAGRYVRATNLTVSEAADAWLAGQRQIVPNTRRNYRDSLKYAKRDLGDKKLANLRQQHIDTWVNDLLDHGSRRGGPLSPDTVRLALTTLKQTTQWATRQGLLPRDPAEYVEPPKAKPTNSVAAGDVWDAGQVRRFLVEAKKNRLYAPLLLSAYGLRRSEVCGMRWCDVDLKAGTVTVAQGYVEVSGKDHDINQPKTARSKRTLPLPADVVAALRDLRTKQKRERLAIGIGWDDEGHVCADEGGVPVLPRTYTAIFQKVRAKAGLPRITLRNLRHSSVSVMLHAGIPPSTVASWHGHDVRMTTAIYGRTFDEGLRAAGGALFASPERDEDHGDQDEQSDEQAG